MAARGRVFELTIGAQELVSLDQDGLKAVCRWVNLEVVKRSDLHKFVVLPKRCIVERTIGWLNRGRRECLNRNALAFLRCHRR